MPGVLTRSPLRSTRPFISFEHANVDPATIAAPEGEERPFGYAYSSPWSTDDAAAKADPQAGWYNAETQTWVGPGGEDITAGYNTYTHTGGCGNGPGCDLYVDDVCA